MGLFDIFNRQRQNGHDHVMAVETAMPDIPEATFIEKENRNSRKKRLFRPSMAEYIFCMIFLTRIMNPKGITTR